MTEVAALEEDMQEYIDKVSVLVAGGMLVVSIPSTLSVGLQVLDYCTADPLLICCHPVHIDTDYWWDSIEDWTRLSRVKESIALYIL